VEKPTQGSFEQRYLEASKNHYSTNIASFDDMEEAKSFVKKNKIEDNTILVISNSNKVMVMHGIYKNREEALNSIDELSDTIKRNNPFIQKIFRTQESFKKNN
ncbi:MAG: SPOR domain-containing protein, partial [Arcobacter sp.]|nr:SPOR domain-containing protein [Arcobacter sp.]